MDTETIEERSITDLQEILRRLGGWPVVEGDGWEGEEGFLWHELSIRAAQEGFQHSRILNIGQAGDILRVKHDNNNLRCGPRPQEL